ncbi:Spy/CpxP family protein refolding chaperone [Marinobacter fonticola]|uniref:Spy/CpxP family protein refolding chaperone n=1 Tax=Marinobacter fonticola TaxID=2603215 RepID=UPI0011E72837|nr:Spy/CpxP family protein refolding chaperone [Marinobacter fonticola]
MKTFKQSRLAIPVALATALAISPLAWSHGSDRDRDPAPRHHDTQDHRSDMKHRFDHLAERLNLTENQRGELRGIFKKRMEARKARFAEEHGEARPNVMTGDPESSAYKNNLKTAADNAAEAARARVEARAAHYRAIYSVLNEDQRGIWDKIQAERKEDMKARHKRHSGPGAKGSRHE